MENLPESYYAFILWGYADSSCGHQTQALYVTTQILLFKCDEWTDFFFHGQDTLYFGGLVQLMLLKA